MLIDKTDKLQQKKKCNILTYVKPILKNIFYFKFDYLSLYPKYSSKYPFIDLEI